MGIMSTAFLEKPLPRQEGIKSQAKQWVTPEDEHRGFVKKVAGDVGKIVPGFKPEQAHPVTAETPVSESPELDKVGAERVGSIKPEFKSSDSGKRDNLYFLRALRSKFFTGESIWGRIGGRGRFWINILRNRILKERKIDKQTDSDF